MTPDFDTVVVGAGVIGLAVARELASRGRDVMVLEKASRAGTETSSRNSEVIHAGIYYPAGSLKAQFCREGRDLLQDYCSTHGVAAQRVGKLIVATSRDDEHKLDAIMALAASNGVGDLQWLSMAEVAVLEPEVVCTKALFSPSTGIVDAAGFMLALQGDGEAAGVQFAFHTEFMSAQERDGMFIIRAADASGDVADIAARNIVNCAGHGAHRVALATGGMDPARLPVRHLAKGSYCSVSGMSPFRHLIYPVPVPGALGIHATVDLGGSVKFGPDIQWVDHIDYHMPDGLPETFAHAVQGYWPGVRGRVLTPSYCGIRPKLHGPDAGFADFLIQSEGQHGVLGLLNLFGIESPGLTASLAVARHVSTLQEKAGAT